MMNASPGAPSNKTRRMHKQHNKMSSDTRFYALHEIPATRKENKKLSCCCDSRSYCMPCSILSAYFFLVKVQHHSAPASAALTGGFRADCIHIIMQSSCTVSSRVCTCIPYRRALSGGRCQGSPATSFQFILITDRQPHPTVYTVVDRAFPVAAARV